MGARIKLKRGTAAQVQLATLSDYEIIFATDAKECYVYDGSSKQLIGQVMSGNIASRPAAGVTNRLYFNSQTGYLEKDSGAEWVQIAVAVSHDHSTASSGGNIPYTSITNFVETVQDTVGGMVESNTEAGLSVSYDDNTGKLNFEFTEADGGLVS
jgi:hypothetical protein